MKKEKMKVEIKAPAMCQDLCQARPSSPRPDNRPATQGQDCHASCSASPPNTHARTRLPPPHGALSQMLPPGLAPLPAPPLQLTYSEGLLGQTLESTMARRAS